MPALGHCSVVLPWAALFFRAAACRTSRFSHGYHVAWITGDRNGGGKRESLVGTWRSISLWFQTCLSSQPLSGSLWFVQGLSECEREEKVWVPVSAAVEAAAAFCSSSPVYVVCLWCKAGCSAQARGCPSSGMIVVPSTLPFSKEVNCLGVHGGIQNRRCLAELSCGWDRSQGLLSLCWTGECRTIWKGGVILEPCLVIWYKYFTSVCLSTQLRVL